MKKQCKNSVNGRNGGTLHPIPKGQSGNPNGRPIGTKNRSTVVKKWLEVEKSTTNPLTGIFEKLHVEDIITLAQISKAIRGKTDAYKVLMDSAYGSANSLEISGGIELNNKPIAETSKTLSDRIEELKNAVNNSVKRNRKGD